MTNSVNDNIQECLSPFFINRKTDISVEQRYQLVPIPHTPNKVNYVGELVLGRPHTCRFSFNKLAKQM